MPIGWPISQAEIERNAVPDRRGDGTDSSETENIRLREIIADLEKIIDEVKNAVQVFISVDRVNINTELDNGREIPRARLEQDLLSVIDIFNRIRIKLGNILLVEIDAPVSWKGKKKKKGLTERETADKLITKVQTKKSARDSIHDLDVLLRTFRSAGSVALPFLATDFRYFFSRSEDIRGSISAQGLRDKVSLVIFYLDGVKAIIDETRQALAEKILGEVEVAVNIDGLPAAVQEVIKKKKGRPKKPHETKKEEPREDDDPDFPDEDGAPSDDISDEDLSGVFVDDDI